jgi:NADH-quinone oxidoreductase subunit E
MAGQTDNKLEQVCKIIENHNCDSSKLIPILQEIQEIYRYLPEEAINLAAKKLKISAAQIYGVATFYAHFSLTPKGKYLIKCCNGTACHVKKSMSVLDALMKKLGLTEKKLTTDDMLFTLEIVSCLGACGLAPVMVIDEDVHGQMTPEKALKLIDDIIAKEKGAAK